MNTDKEITMIASQLIVLDLLGLSSFHVIAIVLCVCAAGRIVAEAVSQ